MRIESVSVDGYGIFSNFELGPLGNLVVIVGPNESGKSTLLAFVRHVLFGFPDARARENRYPALRGGRHGGRLMVNDRQGQSYTIERYSGARGGSLTVTSGGNLVGGQELLDRLLGNASRDLFKNVFAFSLSELQELQTLSSDEVKSRIYSAGLGAGRLSLADVARSFENRQGELYKERGRSQVISKIVSELGQEEQQLRAAQAHIHEYDQEQRQYAKLQQQSSEIRDQYQSTLQKQGHIQNLIQAHEPWISYKTSLEQLKGMEPVETFPVDGLVRLETLLEKRRQLREHLSQFQTKVRSERASADSVQTNQLLLQEEQAIESLKRELVHYESAKRDHDARSAELPLQLEDIEKSLRNLGAGWTAEKVLEFDSSIPTRELVRNNRESLAEAANFRRDAQRTLEMRKDAANEIQAQLSVATRELEQLEEPAEKDPSSIDSRLQLLRRLRDRYLESAQIQQQVSAEESRKEDLVALPDRLKGQQPRAHRLPLWPVIALIIVGLLSCGLLIVSGQREMVIAVALVLLVLVAGYCWLRYQQMKNESEVANQITDQARFLEDQVLRIDANLATLRDKLGDARVELTQLSSQLELTADPSLDDMRQREGETEGAALHLQVWTTLRSRVDQSAQHLEESTQRVQKAEEDLTQAEQEYGRVQEAWREWLRNIELPTTLTPEGCLELLASLDAVREKLRAADVLRHRIGAMEKTITSFEGDVGSVIDKCGVPSGSQRSSVSTVETLGRLLEQSKADRQKVEHLNESIQNDEQECESLEEACATVDQEVSHLLSAGGAENEERFRQRASVYQERIKLKDMAKNLKMGLERIAGTDTVLDRYLEELASTTPEAMDTEQVVVHQKLEELDSTRSAVDLAMGESNNRIAQLESLVSESAVRLRINILKRELELAVQEWALCDTARFLLTKTREKYEKERQPAVIQEAQSFFSRITNSRYRRLMLPLGEERLVVEDSKGTVKQLSELSRGTAEQLYLALRLGLIREFARHSEPMPVIVDDVMVNFDPDRARETCGALSDLAETNQVIFYTCHQATAELWKTVSPECQIVTLAA